MHRGADGARSDECGNGSVAVGVFGHRSVRTGTLTFDHLTPVLRLRQIGPTRTQVTHHTNLSHDYSAVVRLTSSCGHLHCVGQLWDTRHVALLVATSCMECSRGHCVGQRWDAAWLLSYVLYGMLMSAVPIHRAPSAHAHGAQTRNSHVSHTMSSSRPLGR